MTEEKSIPDTSKAEEDLPADGSEEPMQSHTAEGPENNFDRDPFNVPSVPPEMQFPGSLGPSGLGRNGSGMLSGMLPPLKSMSLDLGEFDRRVTTSSFRPKVAKTVSPVAVFSMSSLFKATTEDCTKDCTHNIGEAKRKPQGLSAFLKYDRSKSIDGSVDRSMGRSIDGSMDQSIDRRKSYDDYYYPTHDFPKSGSENQASGSKLTSFLPRLFEPDKPEVYFDYDGVHPNGKQRSVGITRNTTAKRSVGYKNPNRFNSFNPPSPSSEAAIVSLECTGMIPKTPALTRSMSDISKDRLTKGYQYSRRLFDRNFFPAGVIE